MDQIPGVGIVMVCVRQILYVLKHADAHVKGNTLCKFPPDESVEKHEYSPEQLVDDEAYPDNHHCRQLVFKGIEK